MMGFLDNVKKALGSKKENVKSVDSDENSVTDELIDKPIPNEKIRNFKYLDELIHSGMKEIVLDSDIVLGDGEESQYLEGIKLNVDDLTIYGNGHTIDAQGKTRIFYCTGKNITIINITLKNGYGKYSGGAILNSEGSLTITDSTLTENTATWFGGAIYNSESSLMITETTLNNNTAQEKSGGAIHNNNGGEITIIKTTLTGNTANHDGGAINNYNGGEITITKTTLTGNTANHDGGAINNEDGGLINNYNGGEITIIKTTLTGNTANHDGGAIYNEDGGEIAITETTLTGNTANHDGGATYNSTGNLKIFNCEFSSNNSPNNIILNNDSLQIQNTIFKDNQSKDIVLNDDGATLGIFYGEFKENNIEKSILCNDGKFCSIEKTVFQNNISNNTLNIINNTELTLTDPKIKDNGKSILNEKYILIRKSSPGLENKIFGDGTVESIENRVPQGEKFDFGYLDKKIHENKTKEILLDHDITFENYERDFYEGGIELDIDNLIIDGNGNMINGSDKSRIFIITGKNITLKNIVFKNGRSHKDYDNPLNDNGGAIKINHDINVTIENCAFLKNMSEEDGGAIYNRGSLSITETTLNNNTAQEGSGGAIHNQGSSLSITSSTLIGNTANCDGGAILNSEGSLSITSSTLIGNTAPGGGAIHNHGGSLSITETKLNNNTAQEGSGGAIFNSEGSLSITSSTLIGNTAPGGGAIHNHGGSLSITETKLNNNTAQEGSGGAIHNGSFSKLTITESTLTKNTAQKSGGAIHNINGSEITITKTTLTENTAQKDGGAIYNWVKLTITESILTENTAQEGSGGAIYNYWGELTIHESKFTGNTAHDDGGAIYLNESTKKYESENCTFKDNKPDDVYEEK